MPKYQYCSHYDGRCPCLNCKIQCDYRCIEEAEIAVDTDKLCERAKKFCESGRDEDD